MVNKPMRCIIWTAVSTRVQAEEDERFSLPGQEADGLAWCKANTADVVDVLRVPGHSRSYRSLEHLAADARQAKPPIRAFDELIEHLKTADFDVLWCRDANRFARKSSLLHYIVESIIEDCGARIYSQSDGWVDETNYHLWAAMHGFKTAQEMEWLLEAADRGKTKNAEHGLPTGPWLVMSHRRVRDPETGETLAVEVDDSKRLLFDDVATLLLDGVGWAKIGDALYERFGHVDTTGRPFNWTTIYAVVMNPQFWGHSYRTRNRTRKVGRWVFDEECPPPEGITIWRSTIPPFYTGEQAEGVKAELRRRMELKGRSRPQDTYKFTGLLVCEVCGSSMVTVTRHGKRRGLRCSLGGRKNSLRTQRCWERRLATDAYLTDYLNNLILQYLEGTIPDALSAPPEMRDDGLLPRIESEMAALERQLDTLITEQALAPANVQSRYRERVSQLAERLDSLKTRADSLRRQIAVEVEERAAVERTVEEIRVLTLEKLWQLPDRQVNQMLKRMFPSRRFTVRDTKITGWIRTS